VKSKTEFLNLIIEIKIPLFILGIRGAMVARLTPDQKVACSIHVGFKYPDHCPTNTVAFYD
jgi:hypothetical protein